MPEVLTGSCFCGAVRFTIEGPLAPATRCHCSRCRKAFGGAGSAMAPVEPARFAWRSGAETLSRYVGQHGMGIAFCQTCGSTLVGLKDGAVMGVAIGALDDSDAAQIGRHIVVDSKAAWHTIGDAAPQHAEWPIEG